MFYRKEIDGLRSIAVLSVLFYHAQFNMFSGGFIGVDIFFVISGFLITSIILKDLNQSNFSIKNFYLRRARRILPALFFVLFLTSFIGYFILTPMQFKDLSQSIFATSTFSSNIYFYLKLDYFSTQSELIPLIHTWSLAVEEQFYIFFPILCLFVWKFSKKNLFNILCFLSLASIIVSQFFLVHFDIDFDFYMIFSRSWQLLSGSLLSTYLFFKKKNLISNNQFYSNKLAFIGLILIFSSILSFNTSMPSTGLLGIFPILGTILVLGFCNEKSITYKILTTRIFRKIGLISYSLYLIHQPIFVFSRIVLKGEPSVLIYWILIFFCLMISFLSWKYVENFFRKANIVKESSIILISSIGILFFSLFGLFGHFQIIKPNFQLNEFQLERKNTIENHFNERLQKININHSHYSDSERVNKIFPKIDFNQFYEQVNDREINNFKFAIFGDSYAADIAMGFRENGINVFQVSKNGCQLYNKNDTECEQLKQLFINKVKESNVEIVIIVNRFKNENFNSNYFKNVYENFKIEGKKVYLLSPKPDFEYLYDNYPYLSEFQVKHLTGNEKNFQKFYKTIKKNNFDEDFIIINSINIYNSFSDITNGLFSDNKMILFDYGHFTVEGSKIFVKKLMDKL